MIEHRQIVAMWKQGLGDVLITLVRAEGSSYRRPGARILTGTAGGYVGTVSGGCLEAEVVRKAAWSVQAGAVVETYSTLFDDTAEIPYGLGCGGVVDLLVEPIATAECEALVAAMEASLGGAAASVLTWLPRGSGLRRAVCDATGAIVFASQGIGLNEVRAAQESPGEDVFIEQLLPPQRLIVIGAGDDARPIVEIATLLGWSVVIVDGRRQLARAERFSSAAMVLCGGVDTVAVHPNDAVVLMTHSFEQDREWLARLLPIKPKYLGVLGARHRTALLVTEAAERCGMSIGDCCDRIYAPIGLDLGGDGPEAIALAVVAEVQASVMGRLAASRRLTEADVVEQKLVRGASTYLDVKCSL